MTLMSKEQKVDYKTVKAFTRLKQELPADKRVEKIVLVGKEQPLTPNE